MRSLVVARPAVGSGLQCPQSAVSSGTCSGVCVCVCVCDVALCMRARRACQCDNACRVARSRLCGLRVVRLVCLLPALWRRRLHAHCQHHVRRARCTHSRRLRTVPRHMASARPA